MGGTNKIYKLCKRGLNGYGKKSGVNFWRFYFSGTDEASSVSQTFFIELEFVNPFLSPSEIQLGFKPRVKVNQEDLQRALTGDLKSNEILTEEIVQPSFAVVRIGKLGKKSKQLCSYFCQNEIKFSSKKTFEIVLGNKYFSFDRLTGFTNNSEESNSEHPEFFSDSGTASWNLVYSCEKMTDSGFSGKNTRWFPFCLSANVSGTVNFDGNEYIIDSRNRKGFIERFWGSTRVSPWISLSCTSLVSKISGLPLKNSSFALQGIFDERLSLIADFEGTSVEFTADSSKRLYTTVWSFTQSPENEEKDEVHWSISINSKKWVIDIDVFCLVNDLYNRKIELPEGNRKILDLILGSNGYGEIKIYRKSKKSLEQLEYAEIKNCVCEFGKSEESEL